MRWLLALLVWVQAAQAEQAPWAGADILVLGEVHDNPAHHVYQAQIITAAQPTALVVEMLDPQQVLAAGGIDRADAATLGAAFGWNDAGWPDFAIYAPVFAAAPDVPLFGAAVALELLHTAMSQGADAAFGPQAAAYGLTPLEPADQAARQAEQALAHCGALPVDMLPGMVAVQRLRDASFARMAVDAFSQLGGPVIVITGTGHARTDQGVPAAIRAARPDLQVWALGQMEAASPDAPFDAVNVTAPLDRPDPCLAFE